MFVIRAAVTIPKNQAEFMRSGIAAIDTTKRDGNGVSEDEVISNLDAVHRFSAIDETGHSPAETSMTVSVALPACHERPVSKSPVCRPRAGIRDLRVCSESCRSRVPALTPANQQLGRQLKTSPSA